MNEEIRAIVPPRRSKRIGQLFRSVKEATGARKGLVIAVKSSSAFGLRYKYRSQGKRETRYGGDRHESNHADDDAAQNGSCCMLPKIVSSFRAFLIQFAVLHTWLSTRTTCARYDYVPKEFLDPMDKEFAPLHTLPVYAFTKIPQLSLHFFRERLIFTLTMRK